MDNGAGSQRDLERELVDNYPDLALLLQQVAQLHAWQPSPVGDQLLRRLARAVAIILEARMPPAAAAEFAADVIAETRGWLSTRQREQGQSGTRRSLGR